jgi:ubiquinone/menaquinone biosynthesis C-methylase UbiE
MSIEKMYDQSAIFYDAVELSGESNTPLTNALLIKHFKLNNVRTVLDMTCGTGAQSVSIHKAGFVVTGSDLSEGMLEVARKKSEGESIGYYQADMCKVSIGQFDAIISIYNAIGHLKTDDFAKAIRNASNHLNKNGIYIFDIFNSSMMEYIPKHSIIDKATEVGETKYVRYTDFSYDNLTKLLTIKQKTQRQSNFDPIETLNEEYRLKTYSKEELKEIILNNGFSRVEVTGQGMREIFGESGLVNFAIAYK